ncbi:hypothetical protein P12053L_16 [Celeribacter phage P12053L]|uniref:Uncharacterized protein n=1 Tax=Celeribacter phage P12053L TaxID=1197951 RepID=I6R0Y4_9CAUD|nr:hypothetical protein B622_gp16 [Celeribacter phage P12053L]AFM54621.1 hypothetical protein P12053L_16 [Celeribacter phage P12053L]
MSDYQLTRDAAGNITTRYAAMLRNISDDFVDDVVAVSLMEYYNLCLVSNKDEGGQDIDLDTTILEAIERVLEDYLSASDFKAWMLTKGN